MNSAPTSSTHRQRPSADRLAKAYILLSPFLIAVVAAFLVPSHSRHEPVFVLVFFCFLSTGCVLSTRVVLRNNGSDVVWVIYCMFYWLATLSVAILSASKFFAPE